MSNSVSRNKRFLTTHELVIFAMLGAVMFVGDIAFEWLPNVHPVTMLTVLYTVAYGKKGIVPLAVYISLQAVFFPGLWLVPYCYIFPLVWLVTLLVPRKFPLWARQICYTLICTLFGLLFGVLYAPWQALVFIKSFEIKTILAWIAAGFTYDVIHAVGNFTASFLIIPLANILQKIKGLR